jgi:hypothetical protein
MIFIERPITAQHIRDACGRFNEGVRVEYKSTFDTNVRDQLPKIVSSFANSQGGVLVIGVRAVDGVPQPPFNGFAVQAREEFPLTVENICLRNINPPVLPRTHVIQSNVPGQVFLAIEVEESGEAPHAIENSKRVYVRTGNAANPYDLAEVDLIIDLMKRRQEPLERRNRLLSLAEVRSLQVVPVEHVNRPFARLSISPVFPRSPLCTSQQAWEFLRATQFTNASLVPPNSMRRVPEGAASLNHASPPRVQGQYVEVDKYGLMFAAREFAVIAWAGNVDQWEQLYFANLFQTLLRLTICAERFYSAYGYRGNVVMSVSLHHVHGRAMRFVATPTPLPDNPECFRCFTEVVAAERLLIVDRIRENKVDVLTEILADITWAFWQSNQDHPVDRLRQNVERMIEEMHA